MSSSVSVITSRSGVCSPIASPAAVSVSTSPALDVELGAEAQALARPRA